AAREFVGRLRRRGRAARYPGVTMKMRVAVVLVALAAWPLPARAEHARIDLRVSRLDPATGQIKEEATASVDVEPPAGGRNPPLLIKVKAAEPLALQFIFTNTYPHAVIKDVTVRYF